MKIKTLYFFAILAMFFISSCGSDKDKVPADPAQIVYKTDTPVAPVAGSQRPPIINITDTIAIKRIVLVMKDSVSGSDRLGMKMDSIYKKILPAIMEKHKLIATGPRIAWYKTSSAPFFFEAGIPVNKTTSQKLPKNVSIKHIGGDSAFVAHFYGPYSLTFQAYEALSDRMKSAKKKAAGSPYEVYIGDAIDSLGRALDPYRVQTDIVFPHK